MRKHVIIVAVGFLAACESKINGNSDIGPGGVTITEETAKDEPTDGGEPGKPGGPTPEAVVISDSQAAKERVKVKIDAFSRADGFDIELDPSHSVYYVAHKVGPKDSTDCAVRAGYSAFAASAPPTKRLALGPLPDGPVKACIVTVTTPPPADVPLPVAGVNEIEWTRDTTPPVLPVPAVITAMPGMTGTIVLSFPGASDAVAASGLLTYQIFYGDPSVTDPTLLVNGGTTTGPATAGVHDRTVTGLTPGSSYAVTIVVRDPAGNAITYPTAVVTLSGSSGQNPAGPGTFVLSQTTGLTATEGGATATFDVRLSKAPTHDVVITVASADPGQATVSPATLTFTSVDWNNPHVVTVTATPDQIDDGDQPFTVALGAATSADLAFNAVDPADPSGQSIDTDVAGIVRTPASGLQVTEAGGQGTFAVTLASKPTAAVRLTVTSGDAGEITVAPTVLDFTAANWSTAQTVTLTGVADGPDGNQAVNVTIAVDAANTFDDVYDAVTDQIVGATNIEMGTIDLSATSGLVSTEGGAAGTFTVVLSKAPTADVTIGVSMASNAEATVSPSSLTFTTANWSTPRTVTVSAVNDPDDDGDIAYTVVLAAATSTDKAYAGVDPADVTGTAVDDDTGGPVAGLVVSKSSVAVTEAGGDDTFTVRLATAPSADVEVTVASSDTSEASISSAVMTFTSADWNTPRTVTVAGEDDAFQDGNRSFVVYVYVSNTTDPAYQWPSTQLTGLNTDDEAPNPAQLVVSKTTVSVTEPAGTDSFTVALSQAPTDDVGVSLNMGGLFPGAASVFPSNVTFTTGNWSTPQTITVLAGNDIEDNDPNRAFAISLEVNGTNDSLFEHASPKTVTGLTIDNEGGSNSSALGAFAFTGPIASGRADLSTGSVTWTASTNATYYTFTVLDAACATELSSVSGMAEPFGSLDAGMLVDGTTYCARLTSFNDAGQRAASNNDLAFVFDTVGVSGPASVSQKIRGDKVMVTVRPPDGEPDVAGIVVYRDLGTAGMTFENGRVYTVGETFQGGTITIVCKSTSGLCFDDLNDTSEALRAKYVAATFDAALHYSQTDVENHWRHPSMHIGGKMNDAECATMNSKDLCFVTSQGLGVYTIDMTTASTPTVVDLTMLPGHKAGGLSLAGTKVYAADDDGLAVIDAADSGNARSNAVGYWYDQNNQLWDVVARPAGDYAFAIGWTGNLYALDVSSTTPSLVKSVDLVHGDQLALVGNNLYTSSSSTPVVKAVNGDPTAGAAFLTQLDTVTLLANAHASDFLADPQGDKLMLTQSNGRGLVPVEIEAGPNLVERFNPADANQRFSYDWGTYKTTIAGGLHLTAGANEYWILNVFNDYDGNDAATGVRVMRFDGFGATPHLVKETAKDLLYARADKLGIGHRVHDRSALGRIGTKLFASEADRGFSVVSAASLDTSPLSLSGRFSWGNDSNGLAHDATSKILYVSDEKDGVSAIAYGPVETGGFQKTIGTSTLPNRKTNNENAPYEVALTADRQNLFVAMGDDSIQILDVSNPTNMIDLGFHDDSLGTIVGDPVVLTGPDPDTADVVFTASSWISARWVGMVGQAVEARDIPGGSWKVNGNADLMVVAVDDGNRTVTVSGDNTDLTNLAAGQSLHRKGLFNGNITKLLTFKNTANAQFLASIVADGEGNYSFAVYAFNAATDKLTLLGNKSVGIDWDSHMVVVNGHLVFEYEDGSRSLLSGYNIDALTADFAGTNLAFTDFDVTAAHGEGLDGISGMAVSGNQIFTLESDEYVGRFEISAGGVVTRVAGSYAGSLNSPGDLRAPVRIGDRLSFFHRSDCGDGCGTCSLSYVDVSGNDVKTGKSHYIPCEALASYATSCLDNANIGICSAAEQGGVSHWRDDENQ